MSIIIFNVFKCLPFNKIIPDDATMMVIVRGLPVTVWHQASTTWPPYCSYVYIISDITLFLLTVYLYLVRDTESIESPRSIWQAVSIYKSSKMAAHIFILCQVSLRCFCPKINFYFNTNALRLFFVNVHPTCTVH